jgi:hypothetical protein
MSTHDVHLSPAYKHPRLVEITDSPPMTATGKMRSSTSTLGEPSRRPRAARSAARRTHVEDEADGEGCDQQDAADDGEHGVSQ